MGAADCCLLEGGHWDPGIKDLELDLLGEAASVHRLLSGYSRSPLVACGYEPPLVWLWHMLLLSWPWWRQLVLSEGPACLGYTGVLSAVLGLL